MNRLDILPEIIVLSFYVDVRDIAPFPTRKQDFFPERTVLLEDDFSEVFRSGQRTEESGGSSTDDDDVVHERGF